MKKLLTFKWMAMNNTTEVIANIEIERSVKENVAYADGYNIPVGKETYRSIDIRIVVDGKQIERSSFVPQPSNHPKVLETSRFALIGKVAIMKTTYDEMMAIITSTITELEENDEYKAQKEIENIKEAKEKEMEMEAAKSYERQIKNGLCRKCGSYCYGDCEAN